MKLKSRKIFFACIERCPTDSPQGSEIPARTSLGASSVLSIVTIGFSGKDKPQVGYATALDIFIVLCFVNVFMALVEFAVINFLDTLVRRLKRKGSLLYIY